MKPSVLRLFLMLSVVLGMVSLSSHFRNSYCEISSNSHPRYFIAQVSGSGDSTFSVLARMYPQTKFHSLSFGVSIPATDAHRDFFQNLFAIELSSDPFVADTVLNHLRSDSSIVFIEEDVSVSVAPTHLSLSGSFFDFSRVPYRFEPYSQIRLIPNDPFYPYDAAEHAIDADKAWSLCASASGIAVIMDTGMAWSHDDLSGNIFQNYAETGGELGVDDDDNGIVDDYHGCNILTRTNDPTDDYIGWHGTRCAGIIGAVGNNGLGKAGILWSVPLLPVKVFDADGYSRVSFLIEASQYALFVHRASSVPMVVNESFTLAGHSELFLKTCSVLGEEGIIIVAAAGNGGVDGTDEPAGYNLPNIISVGAYDFAKDEIASFSNYGPRVHIFAEGERVLSTVGSGYDVGSGTSFATPTVAGAVLGIMRLHPTATPSVVREILMASATRRRGVPLLNLRKAYAMAVRRAR